MTDSPEQHHHNSSNEPQCQFFVQRKKRLCRMTVKPGRMYCGEHEPQPKTTEGQDDSRIPCPNDPKHTCYASKLEKHLKICNARPRDEEPRYIVQNINIPSDIEVCERKPLSQLSKETILSVIEKVNTIYDDDEVQNLLSAIHKAQYHKLPRPGNDKREKWIQIVKNNRCDETWLQSNVSRVCFVFEVDSHFTDSDKYTTKADRNLLKKIATPYDCVITNINEYIDGNITTEPELPIHSTVVDEFSESDRGESSLRHLRQVSNLLWLTEREGLVKDYTCYAELGAGRGVMSYYACQAWCGSEWRDCSALLVDRASPRHKRDNKLRQRAAWRVRADLRHLALYRVPAVQGSGAVVGLAKHLCGVATDYALRSLCAQKLPKTRGVVLATCCHHRCEQVAYVGNKHLLDLGITGDDLNVMLGLVSWATCGDGRSRECRNVPGRSDDDEGSDDQGPENLFLKVPKHKVRAHDATHAPDDAGHGPDDAGHEPDDAAHGPDDAGHGADSAEGVHSRLVLPQQYRAEVGRRAKHIIDWGRVLYLRDHQFHARLTYYVPTSVSLENVCIVAKRIVTRP